MQRGFVKDNIDVSNRAATGSANTAAETTTTRVGIMDSVGNFFNSLFGDDETTARNYADAAGSADAILTVHVDSDERARAAAEILDRNGAIDIDEASAHQRQNNVTETSTQQTQRNVAATTETANRNTADVQGERAIPIIEEQMQVGKREVERGGARIRSRIVEKPVEASVRLREEHVVVDRRAVNRAVTDADLANSRQGDIELTERAEVPVVDKQARVVEEVVVGKNVAEHQETVRDTVKRTDVDVEEVDGDTATRRADNRS
jgi:uncharacterized protein (TIGR02271 family)